MSRRRPRKSAKQWERLIEQQVDSGMSIAEFCQQRDVAFSTFSKWHRKFKTRAVTTHSAFKPVKTPEPIVAKQPDTEISVVSVQVGTDVLLTIRSGERSP